MDSAINWHDEYTFTKDRIVYTDRQLHIPGLRTLARHQMVNAIPALAWHFHENSFEFSVATKGNITFSTQTASYNFSGGDVFVAFPDEIHGTNYAPVSVGELYWFQLDTSDPENFLFLNKASAQDMIDRLKNIHHHIVQTDGQQTVPLLKNAFRLAQTNGNPAFIASYLQLFLYLILDSSGKERIRLSSDIGKALDYILDHIAEPLSLEELSSIANLSCSQFKQKFKKQLGISPRCFINQQKVEYSKSLLLEGMSVTEIAMLLNFTTSSYFSTVFKKYTLLTPLAYIKASKGKRLK